ncbi:MAG: phosphatidylglycerophosphatase A [Candidatus Marinimicrobia bacterium]|nr:phosphatidylglycerophosphatase A [Candidatus Neomarinimicrobiota bacterium]
MPGSQSKSLTDRWHLFLATFAGTGYIPLAPGSWGSLFGAILFWFLAPYPTWMLILITGIVFFLGVWSSTYIENTTNTTDPGMIVIDEVAGMWFVLLFVPQSFVHYLYAFILFRIFDVLKPPPASQLQSVHKGWGVMLDDIAAGVYAVLLMLIGMWIF